MKMLLLLLDDPIEVSHARDGPQTVFHLSVVVFSLSWQTLGYFKQTHYHLFGLRSSRLVPASQWRQMIVFFFLTTSQYFILLHLQELLVDVQGFFR